MLTNVLVQSLLLSLLLQSGVPALRWSFDADPVGGLPARWAVRGTSKAVYRVETENSNRYLSAVSQNTDSQLGVEVLVRAQDYPTLSWRWRALELPRGGDERHEKTLDSAAAVYAVFGSRLFPRVLKYVWSTSAPAGISFKNPTSGRMEIFVLNSGPASLGQWQAVQRNLVEDYRKAFGSAPGNLIGIAVKTDSDSTKTSASADYDDIELTRR